MTCQYCNNTGWILYKGPAPSPPYDKEDLLEYAKRCVCQGEYKRPTKNFQDS